MQAALLALVVLTLLGVVTLAASGGHPNGHGRTSDRQVPSVDPGRSGDAARDRLRAHPRRNRHLVLPASRRVAAAQAFELDPQLLPRPDPDGRDRALRLSSANRQEPEREGAEGAAATAGPERGPAARAQEPFEAAPGAHGGGQLVDRRGSWRLVAPRRRLAGRPQTAARPVADRASRSRTRSPRWRPRASTTCAARATHAGP